MKNVIAFDFGASSGRAIKASFDGDKITCKEIHRFENTPINIEGHICHNIDMITGEIKIAIEKAGTVDSMAFDTWGVDYALLDKNGRLLHTPYHYRDVRTAGILDSARKKMDFSQLYSETGNQIMNINTLFQLMSDENLKNADSLLFIPDLFVYLFTGKKACEKTIASTSQMFNPVTKMMSGKVLETFGIDKRIFAPLTDSGTISGEYKGIKVISVAGHDTQCAVAAMPGSSKNTAFLSCGTWSLIGCELDEPILTAQSNRALLSNELGANGKINYLKNISGLWLMQEVRRECKNAGLNYTYDDLELLARECEPFKCLIDTDDESLSAHGMLCAKIKEYCKKTGQYLPETTGEMVRCIYDSLALKYRMALNQISECAHKHFDSLNLLGGGAKDAFLCELTASSLGIPVIAGPVEATALGNIIIQLIALGDIKDIDSGRNIIARTQNVKTYAPNHTSDWDNAYNKFLTIINH